MNHDRIPALMRNHHSHLCQRRTFEKNQFKFGNKQSNFFKFHLYSNKIGAKIHQKVAVHHQAKLSSRLKKTKRQHRIQMKIMANMKIKPIRFSANQIQSTMAITLETIKIIKRQKLQPPRNVHQRYLVKYRSSVI